MSKEDKKEIILKSSHYLLFERKFMKIFFLKIEKNENMFLPWTTETSATQKHEILQSVSLTKDLNVAYATFYIATLKSFA